MFFLILHFLGEHRTNNVLEGYHNSLRNHFEYAHPNIWQFLDKLIKYQLGVDVDIRQLKENGPPSKRKHDKYDSQARICMEYTRSNSIEFIVQIAKTM